MAEGSIRWKGYSRRGRAYRSFLLRCWLEPGTGPEAKSSWRFTLVQAEGEGGQKAFANLEDMTAYLRETLYKDALQAGLEQ